MARFDQVLTLLRGRAADPFAPLDCFILVYTNIHLMWASQFPAQRDDSPPACTLPFGRVPAPPRGSALASCSGVVSGMRKSLPRKSRASFHAGGRARST